MPKYYYIPLSKSNEPAAPAATNPLIDRTRSVVLMTADDPWDKSMKGKFTTEGDLATDLKQHGVEFELTHGKYKKPEQSVIAYDMPLELAHHLAKKYGQESFIHIDPKQDGAKLIYSNGNGYADSKHDDNTPEHQRSPSIPLEGSMHTEAGAPELFDQAPEDFYTFVPSANKFIRLNFDFDTRHQSPHMKNEALAQFQGENTMKSEYTVQEALGEIAKVLKKYEAELAELHKKESHSGQLPHTDKEERKIKHIAAAYEKKGKSPKQSKAIAYATVNEQHKAESCAKCGKSECECKAEGMSCKKCGEMTKAGSMCAKCGEMSAGKPTEKNEAVSMFSKDGDKDAKGQDKIPEKTKKAPAKDDGSGGDVSKGKMGKAEESMKMLLELEELTKSLALGTPPAPKASQLMPKIPKASPKIPSVGKKTNAPEAAKAEESVEKGVHNIV